jgi:hypothetical protein
VAQFYPWARGSLFAASYDSQGYGGGILTLLHTGYKDYILPLLFYICENRMIIQLSAEYVVCICMYIINGCPLCHAKNGPYLENILNLI